MDDPEARIAYWEGAGATKTFTHPVNVDWLKNLDLSAPVLDYGCGYGRVLSELREHGFTDLTGVDPSRALIDRGRRLHPHLDLAVLPSPPEVPSESARYSLVMLFAVLTCIPDDSAQHELMAELSRILAPGGLVYLSDMVMQDDGPSIERYAAHRLRHGLPYGVFVTDDGARVRHHDMQHLRALVGSFEVVAEDSIDVLTMNGHRARAAQLLVRRK